MIMEMLSMLRRSFINRYFSESEMSCNCGCGLMPKNRKFLERLHRAREKAGVTFPINSWIRCPEHNKKVGGRENSAHLEGIAVDIKVASYNTHKRYKIIKALMEEGFNRIGIYSWGIHVDSSESLPKEQFWMG
jgi:uncharacterized protein YcbK (DUF882 family)